MELLRLSDASLTVFDSLTVDSVDEVLVAWSSFCSIVEALLGGSRDICLEPELISSVHCLCQHGLQSRVQDHFIRSLEVTFESKGASRFWQQLDSYNRQSVMTLEDDDDGLELVLCRALEEISLEKRYHEKCLLMVGHAIQSYESQLSSSEHNSIVTTAYLLSKYQLVASSVLMSLHPGHFPEILHWYFKKRLEELSSLMDSASDYEVSHDRDNMDIDESLNQSKFSAKNELVSKIGRVVQELRNLGFSSMTEDAYASAIFLLLKAKVHELAGDDYRSSVLEPIKGWIEAVPLQFLHSLLAYLGESVDVDSSSLKSSLDSCPSGLYPGNGDPSESLIRWKLRLEYFAYESLQDLRITKLFEIIVDYPDSSPAIEDLKQCLDYTGQHSKLVDLFISALKYRLLTASASTNDILHQYVSTIKALRTIDPAGVFLEAVSEPIREYLRGRKDTIKCIVTMLTDGSGENPSLGNAGDSLLEELNRDEENQDNTGLYDDINLDDKQAWINSQSWEPDPIEADPLKHSTHVRKVDILGMIVGIIGSKDQLVTEYRVMLAEKLLNKSDYDIDSEIRTLELLKIHFGEGIMQRCEIMLNDLIDSKRVNSNIKATRSKQPQAGAELREHGLPLDLFTSTIISTNFWPPIQEETYNLPTQVDQLLTDYAKTFHELKAPRKLQWKKNLGLVKLELQFEDKEVQFSVAPMHAAIIMQFQDQSSWTSKNLAVALGVPTDTLNRRINFWISKGILRDSTGETPDDRIFTLVDGNADGRKNNLHDGSNEDFLCGDDDSERSVASVGDQLRQEMTVYEKFIMGMLTNFGSMSLDKIHNTLKIFCIAEPKYDKSLNQLQSFLSDLIAQERLEHRDGLFYLKK